MIIYKYIFCKAYYIAIRVFKETEFPWAFGAIVVTLCLVMTILDILQIVRYLMLPKRIDMYDQFHSYIALALCAAIQIYAWRNKKYISILQDCKSISPQKRRILRVVSVIYILIIVVGFLELPGLTRNK